jgi:hypothetical protein
MRFDAQADIADRLTAAAGTKSVGNPPEIIGKIPHSLF